MRKLAIAVALASTALATPAVARDHSGYVGLEGGVLFVEDMDVDFDDGTLSLPDAITVTHNTGWDVDLIAGYDFGMVRLEAELGYKRASVNQLRVDPRISGGGPGDNFDADGRGRALSGMVNLLLDFGNDDGLSGYAGVGVGLASVKYTADAVVPSGVVEFSDTDSGIAWQGILGLRYAVSPNFDVGLKYRFFNVPNLKFAASGVQGSVIDLDGRWRSHSLLASLIYNFYSPAPPPPPPPPPPAPERG
jgi:opacity protein-like surface antigen